MPHTRELMDPAEILHCESRIREALTELRPFLEADGGDISLEEVTPDGVVRVRLHGACISCSMSPMTMKAGVEETIRRVAPSIKRVEAVNLVATMGSR